MSYAFDNSKMKNADDSFVFENKTQNEQFSIDRIIYKSPVPFVADRDFLTLGVRKVLDDGSYVAFRHSIKDKITDNSFVILFANLLMISDKV